MWHLRIKNPEYSCYFIALIYSYKCVMLQGCFVVFKKWWQDCRGLQQSTRFTRESFDLTNEDTKDIKQGLIQSREHSIEKQGNILCRGA